MSALYPTAGDPSDVADQARRLADALDYLATCGRPPAVDLAYAPVLDGWRPSLRTTPVLVGFVAGHPQLGSNRLIRTSEIFAMDSNRQWARTWSRFYRLGSVSAEGKLQ